MSKESLNLTVFQKDWLNFISNIKLSNDNTIKICENCCYFKVDNGTVVFHHLDLLACIETTIDPMDKNRFNLSLDFNKTFELSLYRNCIRNYIQKKVMTK